MRESTASSSAVHSSTGHPSPFHDTVGLTTRAEIEASHANWRTVEHAPAVAPSRALAEVPPGAEVDVFLGTWCGDSRQHITRLFAALELAQQVPFRLRVIGVDRTKHALNPTSNVDWTEGRDIRFVPTLVVVREGIEVGRIVEHPTRSVEEDLLDLLTGTRHGFLSLTRTP